MWPPCIVDPSARDAALRPRRRRKCRCKRQFSCRPRGPPCVDCHLHSPPVECHPRAQMGTSKFTLAALKIVGAASARIFALFCPKPYVRTSMLAILVTHDGIDRRKITWNPNKNIRLEHALPIEIQPFDGFQVLTWIAFWTAFLERNCTGMPTVQIFIHEFDPRIVQPPEATIVLGKLWCNSMQFLGPKWDIPLVSSRTYRQLAFKW